MSKKPVNSADRPWPSSDRVKIERAETLSDNWGRLTKYSIAYRRGDGVTEQQSREVYDRGNGAAIVHTIILLLAGMADNVLKPLMLGRGVDAPMPVILLGALGGMATGGILGMFVGATLLALGYQIFMSWVATNPDAT